VYHWGRACRLIGVVGIGALVLLTCRIISDHNELAMGQTVERRIHGHRRHSYEIALDAGRYLRVTVDQLDADIALVVMAPGARTGHEVDREGPGGYEDVSVLTDVAGVCRLELRAADALAPAGRYRLRVLELREPVPFDHERIRAERAFDDGLRLSTEATSRSLAQAIEKYREAARRFEAAAAPAQQAAVLDDMGMAYASRGQSQQAIETLEHALRLARMVGDAHREATVLNNMGTVHREQGRAREGLDCLARSVAAMEAAGDRVGAAVTRHNVAFALLGLGDGDAAVETLGKALPVLKAESGAWYRGSVLVTLAKAYLLTGRSRDALAVLDEALPLWRGLAASSGKGRWGEATALDTLGLVLHSMGEPQRALESLQKALEVRRTLGPRLQIAVSLNHLGQVLLALGRPREAHACYEEARQMAAAGDRSIEAASLQGLARSERDLGRLDVARAAIESALERVDSLRAHIDRHALRASFLASVHDYYTLAIDVRMRLDSAQPGRGHAAAALSIAERARARTFLDLLAESDVDLSQDLDPQQRAREMDLIGRITAVQKELWNRHLTEQEEQDLLAQLQAAERDLEASRLELRRTHPRYAALHLPEPLEAKTIARQMTAPDTALVAYALGDPHSFAWVVADGKVQAARLPARETIERLVAAHYEALSRPVATLDVDRALARLDATARALSEAVFAPVAGWLQARRRLVIIPDGALVYVPFETLASGPAAPAGAQPAPHYLLERFAISYAPSASVLRAMAARRAPRPQPRGLLAFGDPITNGRGSVPAAARLDAARGLSFNPLPYTRAEVEGIAALFGADEREIHLGAGAVEEAVKTASLSRYRYLHFASHGHIVEDKPWRSGILLSPSDREDGLLQVGEIASLRLNADLVTLSACRTGLGKLMRGEGMMGLTRAFAHAGARRVLVTLWDVNDMTTAGLMLDFYKGLRRGLAPAEALQRAKRGFLRDPASRRRHPYYWAPFTLVGA